MSNIIIGISSLIIIKLSKILILSILITFCLWVFYCVILPTTHLKTMSFGIFIGWIINVLTRFDFGSLANGKSVSNIVIGSVITSLVISSIAAMISMLFSSILAFIKIWHRKTYPRIADNIIKSVSSLPVLIVCILAFAFVSGFDEFGKIVCAILILALCDSNYFDMSSNISREMQKLHSSSYMHFVRIRGGNEIYNSSKELVLILVSSFNARFALLLSGTIVLEYIFTIGGIGFAIIRYESEIELLLGITFLVSMIVLSVRTSLLTINDLLNPQR